MGRKKTMHYEDKTKEQLINELTELRKHIGGLGELERRYHNTAAEPDESDELYQSILEASSN
jgi:hypothetical protein